MCNFFQLKDAVIVDASNILFYELEVFHSLHNLLFLFQSCLIGTYVNFLLKHEFKVITWIVLPVSDKIKMIQWANEVGSKLLKFSINAIFKVSKGDIELYVVEFIHAN